MSPSHGTLWCSRAELGLEHYLIPFLKSKCPFKLQLRNNSSESIDLLIDSILHDKLYTLSPANSHWMVLSEESDGKFRKKAELTMSALRNRFAPSGQFTVAFLKHSGIRGTRSQRSSTAVTSCQKKVRSSLAAKRIPWTQLSTAFLSHPSASDPARAARRM